VRGGGLGRKCTKNSILTPHTIALELFARCNIPGKRHILPIILIPDLSSTFPLSRHLRINSREIYEPSECAMRIIFYSSPLPPLRGFICCLNVLSMKLICPSTSMGNDSSGESLEFELESHSNPAKLSAMRWISHSSSFEEIRANRWDRNVR
jgi:hypothetical protein